MPRLVLQPEGSALCGQCCVAMAAGVSLRRVIKLMGDSPAGVGTAEIRLALDSFGLKCAPRMRVVKDKLGPVQVRRALLHTVQRVPSTVNHWTLLWDGGVFDPGGPYTALYYPTTIVSYLEIY